MLKSKKALFALLLILLATWVTASMSLNLVRACGDDGGSSGGEDFKFGWKCKNCYAILVVIVKDCETGSPLEGSTVRVTVPEGAFIKGSLLGKWKTGSLSKKTVLFPPKPYWWPRNREWPNTALAVFFIKFKPGTTGCGLITVKTEISKPGYISKEVDVVIKNRCRFNICPRFCLNIETQCLQKAPPSAPEFPVETGFVLFSATAGYLVMKRKLRKK